MSKEVTISEDEYEELKSDSKFLAALFSAGVDNWEGYDYAVELIDNITGKEMI